ncbi:immunoglobulin J chain [Corvus cornix cornix]|uniref:Joining chain of multimeric IgA and IgM n=1 Tax=Corvus moneduloides TaxID=1196302 RepID=A0A8U7N2A4_CORMO|nr:PREDICTED: immunoglobulin J chain [Corvus brachyrhynchos]XP_010409613.1 immunoglobulin J chain [Corvus cornix cornix]XP_031965191.1 immunoglobulin J chain [Corvus moneduloides]XP_041882876.1 immunoglobulin J chain [Corvus kubaryi]
MKSSLLLCVALAVSLGIVLVAGYPVGPTNAEYVLVNNKCQCVTVTSKFVPSKENPDEEVLERNIRIIVPLKARENISDPLSPLRTTFVYRLSELCKNCDPVEIELGGGIHQAQQGNSCEEPQTCYTYDRNECYSSPVPLLYHGEVRQVPAALTPASCFAE